MHYRLRVMIASLVLPALMVHARINLVTLPNRDSVQLTIYNSVDLTMVKETRVLTFQEGINKLEFSWANTLIDPTSVDFRCLSHPDRVDVIDVSFPPRVQNTLEWRIRSEVAGEATVEIRYFTSGISWSADYTATANPDEARMDLSGQVKVTNLSGEDYENAQVRLVVGVIQLVEEIRALAKGNGIEADFAPAIEAAAGRPASTYFYNSMEREYFGAALNRPKEIVKEGLSEYFIYTIEGRDTIPNGWSKALPSFHTDDVPVTSYYKYEQAEWGDQAMRFYRFTNNVPSHLGTEPLPDGQVFAFRSKPDQNRLAFVGQTRTKYIPVDEQVDLQLGTDREVRVEPILMDWRKTDIRFNRNGNVGGYTLKQDWKIEVQNSRDIPVIVDIRRNFLPKFEKLYRVQPGDTLSSIARKFGSSVKEVAKLNKLPDPDRIVSGQTVAVPVTATDPAFKWSIETEHEYEKVDANKVKFLVKLDPGTSHSITYTLTQQIGMR